MHTLFFEACQDSHTASFLPREATTQSRRFPSAGIKYRYFTAVLLSASDAAPAARELRYRKT